MRRSHLHPYLWYFNQSICLGIFPDDWKCARFSPLFKQGDRDDLNNYRPISVISVVAKVFEKIVVLSIIFHDIICKYQWRLYMRPRLLAHMIDRGKINDVVFLDLKKAFDPVDHESFFKKTEPVNLYCFSHFKRTAHKRVPSMVSSLAVAPIVKLWCPSAYYFIIISIIY